MSFDIKALKKSQEVAKDKYKVSGSDFPRVITMSLTHEGKENSVTFSLLPPEINGSKLYEVSPSGNLIIPYNTVFINGKFFEIKGTSDDPINSFLWNRYNDYKAKGLDTANLVLPNRRYLAVSYIYKNKKEPDYNDTVQVIGFPRTLFKSFVNKEKEYIDDYPGSFIFGVIDVAVWKSEYEMTTSKFGVYSLSALPPSSIIDTSDEEKAEAKFNSIVSQAQEVCQGYNRIATGEAFANYDDTVKRFIETVGVAAWKKYGPDTFSVASTPDKKSLAEAIGDDLPDDYKSTPDITNEVPWDDGAESYESGASSENDDDDIDIDALVAEIDKEV